MRYERVSRWGLPAASSLVLNGLLLAALATGLEYREPKPPEEYRAPLVRRQGIPKPHHVIPLIGDAYYSELDQPMGVSAFYEDIMGGTGEVGRVAFPWDSEGRYIIFTNRETTCSGCHQDVELEGPQPEKRPGRYPA